MYCRYCGSNIADLTVCPSCGAPSTLLTASNITQKTTFVGRFYKKYKQILLGCILGMAIAGILLAAFSFIQSRSVITEPFVPVDSAYIVPEYEKFNSWGSENGLTDTKIAFRGVVSTVNTETNAIYMVVTTDEGDWLVLLGIEDVLPRVLAAELSGKVVDVYGNYDGFSGVAQLPSCSVMMPEDRFFIVESGERYNFTWEWAVETYLG